MLIYSNAFNFESYLNGGVDPRTGQYGSTIRLATISAEGPVDSSRDIRLSFSMMEERNTGYGLGWTLSTSEYNETTRQLRLLGGQIYTTDPLPPVGAAFPVRLLDRKLNDMVVRRVDANILHVIYKDGIVEVLRRLRQSPVFLLDQLIFDNGEKVNFSYTWLAAADRLTSVRHATSQRELLVLRYSNDVLSQADALQERGRIARSHFSHLNGRLISVSVPLEANQSPANQPVFTFGYQNIGDFLAISSLRNPMGGEDFIKHDALGHAFHNNQRIPFVSRLISRIGGGVSDVVHQYVYSQNNFTGFPFLQFEPGRDNLYQQLGTYDYWCRDTVLGAGSAVLQQRQVTFNRFHLQSSDVTSRSETSHAVHHLYNDIAGEPFSNQPANLHLPRYVITRYQTGNRYRDETESIETDGYGNQLVTVAPSGMRIEYSYFPIGGIAGKCPPEPHGLFQRFLREERILPLSGSLTRRITEHTYKAIDGLAGGLPRIVSESSYFNQQLQHWSFYINSPGSTVEHGRLSETQTLVNGWITRTSFGYQLSGDEFTERQYVIGHNGSTLVSTAMKSVVTRRDLSIQKNESVKVNIDYDIIGRVITETVSPGTDNKATRQYAYQYASGSNMANVVTTDAMGGRYVTRYDGLSRIVSVAKINPTGDQYVRRNAYDQLGQLVTETTVDHIDGNEINLVTRYHYNGWGQVTQTTRPDKSIAFTDYDPIDRVRLEGVSGAGYVRSYENNFDKVVRVQQVGTDNQAIEMVSRTFDGFGRCASEADVDGNRTNFDYDVFDRVIKETVTPRSGAVRIIQIEYPAHLVESLKASIKVGDVLLARCTYDDVGRLLAQYRGDSSEATTFTYAYGSMQPSSIRSPTGVVKQYQFDAQLNALTQIRIADQPVSSFGVHPNTGALTSTVNSESTRTIQYDEFGRVRSDTQMVNGSNFSNSYLYSMAGRLLHFDSALGDSEHRYYDSEGRLYAMQVYGGATGTSQVSLNYDSAGRIINLSVTAENRTFASIVSYDVFGRESIRRITQNGYLFQTLLLTYHSNNKIASRRMTDANQADLSTETFAYDSYGRLANYACNGPRYPVDQRGRSIRSQAFTYDALNNMTRVVTGMVGEVDDVATRYHGGSDPSQLTQITTTNPARVVQLRYDASGQLESDGVRVFSYDNLGRLVAVNSEGRMVSSYGYDASGRQIRQADVNGNSVSLHFSADGIVGISQGASRARFIRLEESVPARSINALGTEINVSDGAASVRTIVAVNGAARHILYSPYGISDLDGAGAGTLQERNRPGFNGERYDPLGQLYHLGNGRRAYSPELMIFLSPDPLSPFGEGGLNSYGYCGGDPINFIDPSGLSEMAAWARWLLIGLGVVVGAVMIAGVGSAVLTAVRTLVRFSNVLSATANSLAGLGRGAAQVRNLASNVGGGLSNIATVGTQVGRSMSNLASGASNVGASLSQVGTVGSRVASLASNAGAEARSWGSTVSAASAPVRGHARVVGRGISDMATNASNVRQDLASVAALTSCSIQNAGAAIRADFARNARPQFDLNLFSEEMIFEPLAGEVSGVIDGVQDFDNEFGALTDKIRASEMKDIR